MDRINNIGTVLIFMIILILSSCQDSPNIVFKNPNEQAAYELFMEDYDSPRYKWGYIDTVGSVVIANAYDDCRDFAEGRAAVLVDGLWGYIDKDGNQIVPPRYRSVQEYSDGLALVNTFDDQYLYLDKEGSVVVDTLPYSEVYGFANGLARVHDGTYYGYIDKTGRLTIPCKYQTATNFKNGYALISNFGKANVITTSGKAILQDRIAEKVYYPKAGLIRYKASGKYRFADLTGRDIINKGFESATDFQQDFAIVFDGRDTYTISQSGKLKELPYRTIDTGGENKWIYRSDSKCGYLKNNGDPLTLPNYLLCTRYKDAMAAVQDRTEAWGYVGSTGQLAIKPAYPLAWDFNNGRARMINKNGFGFIDKKGQFVIDPYYIEVRDFYEGLARVQIFRGS